MAQTRPEAPSSPGAEEIFHKILVVMDPTRRKVRRDVENQVDWVEVDLESELVDKIFQSNGCRQFVYPSSGDDVPAGHSRVWIHEFVSLNGLTALKLAFIMKIKQIKQVLVVYRWLEHPKIRLVPDVFEWEGFRDMIIGKSQYNMEQLGEQYCCLVGGAELGLSLEYVFLFYKRFGWLDEFSRNGAYGLSAKDQELYLKNIRILNKQMMIWPSPEEQLSKEDIPWVLYKFHMIYLRDQGRDAEGLRKIAQALKEAA